MTLPPWPKPLLDLLLHLGFHPEYSAMWGGVIMSVGPQVAVVHHVYWNPAKPWWFVVREEQGDYQEAGYPDHDLLAAALWEMVGQGEWPDLGPQ